MKNKTLFLLTSLCSICLLTSACTTTCPTQTHDKHGMPEQHHKHHKQKVKANMTTRSANGGTTEMGTIWFTETPDGLQMTVDLVYLRPNKTYTAEIYQCGPCNDSICCANETMSIDLPQLQINNDGERLKQSYIVPGLTAAQLNNAKLLLKRDGGYQAAWGTLKQK